MGSVVVAVQVSRVADARCGRSQRRVGAVSGDLVTDADVDSAGEAQPRPSAGAVEAALDLVLMARAASALLVVVATVRPAQVWFTSISATSRATGWVVVTTVLGICIDRAGLAGAQRARLAEASQGASKRRGW